MLKKRIFLRHDNAYQLVTRLGQVRQNAHRTKSSHPHTSVMWLDGRPCGLSLAMSHVQIRHPDVKDDEGSENVAYTGLAKARRRIIQQQYGKDILGKFYPFFKIRVDNCCGTIWIRTYYQRHLVDLFSLARCVRVKYRIRGHRRARTQFNGDR